MPLKLFAVSWSLSLSQPNSVRLDFTWSKNSDLKMHIRSCSRARLGHARILMACAHLSLSYYSLSISTSLLNIRKLSVY
jgi:hypothetical protein